MRPSKAKLNGSLAGRLTATALLGLALGGCALLTDGGEAPTPLAALAGGEALVQTADGRIFVTGREATFKLSGLGESDPRLSRLPVQADVPAGCQYTGAATWQDWLFTVCTVGDRSYLLRGRLGIGLPVLTRAATLEAVAIASGLAADRQGRLYVADSRHEGTAVTRIEGATEADFDVKPQPWLQDTRGGFPNGVQYANDTIYVTSAGRLSAVPIEDDGQAGEPRAITTRLTFLDDFHILPQGGFLLTDYSFNRLLLIDPSGIEHGSFGGGSKGPTAVLLTVDDNGEPMVLITERDGERVSRLEVPEALRPYLWSAPPSEPARD